MLIGATLLDNPKDDHAGQGRIIQFDADLNEKGVLWLTGTTHLVYGLGFAPDGTLWAQDPWAWTTVRVSPTPWAKPCLERSPLGDVSAVSVVTNTWSDDANNELLAEPRCHLRLTRKGNVFAMHYSLDGQLWRFVRPFGMALPPTVMVGIHAQAPFVGGCSARFATFTMSSEPVYDFRSGE